MTGEEYRVALRRLGWSQAKLAGRLGFHVNSATNWGKSGPPAHVVEYLRVMLLAREMLDGA